VAHRTKPELILAILFSELLRESQLLCEKKMAIITGDSQWRFCSAILIDAKIGLSEKEGNQNWLLIIDILILHLYLHIIY